jgi:Flavin containing amine oxidoreductase
VIPERCDTVVIGAGLAGLACATTLLRAGHDVHLVEASDGVGGRVRTDHVDGFTLDRGFQILLTAYPEVQRQLDVARLRLQAFDPGALIWVHGRGYSVSDPFRSPRSIVSSVVAPIGTLGDKARVARLRRRLLHTPSRELLRGPDVPTMAAVQDAGFSRRIVSSFFTPLVGGIQLDPQLRDSNRMFEVIFRSLSEGDAAVPAEGMQAIPDQLAEQLPPERLHLSRRVAALDGTGVRLSDGQVIDATRVVVATEGPAAAGLLGIEPVRSKAASAVWFAAPAAPVPGKAIVLDGTGNGPVLNVAVMSNVAPSYAPPGQSLIVAALPGLAAHDAEALARTQLRSWWGPVVDRWRTLRTDVIAHGQPEQRPPFAPRRRVSLGNGWYVCGDHRDTASIQGALFSGRRTAELIAQEHS